MQDIREEEEITQHQCIVALFWTENAATNQRLAIAGARLIRLRDDYFQI